MKSLSFLQNQNWFPWMKRKMGWELQANLSQHPQGFLTFGMFWENPQESLYLKLQASSVSLTGGFRACRKYFWACTLPICEQSSSGSCPNSTGTLEGVLPSSLLLSLSLPIFSRSSLSLLLSLPATQYPPNSSLFFSLFFLPHLGQGFLVWVFSIFSAP